MSIPTVDTILLVLKAMVHWNINSHGWQDFGSTMLRSTEMSTPTVGRILVALKATVVDYDSLQETYSLPVFR